jgi:hypothetical protein
MYAIMKTSPCGVAEKIYCTPWEVTQYLEDGIMY